MRPDFQMSGATDEYLMMDLFCFCGNNVFHEMQTFKFFPNHDFFIFMSTERVPVYVLIISHVF